MSYIIVNFVSDWYELRKKHRICGSVIGTFGMLAHQDRLLSLPLALMPEETHFLLTEKIARLVEYEAFRQKPSGDLRQKFEEFRAQSYLDQVRFLQNIFFLIKQCGFIIY